MKKVKKCKHKPKEEIKVTLPTIETKIVKCTICGKVLKKDVSW